MSELEEKTERLVRLLTENGLDAVILNAQHNFAWISGGGLNGVDLSRENGVASLMISRDGRKFIVANNIEMQRMLTEQVGGSFEPVEFPWQAEKADGSIVLRNEKNMLGDG
ncbi:MAG: aminopeptidase P family N-terminal domain-containing protein, partial [Pyrinomonadaceae bacterium]